MTLDRTAHDLAALVQQAQTVQHASAPSGGHAGTTISLRINERAVHARCLTAIAPGPVIAVLTATGWACLPVAATKLVGVRQVEFRQRRGDVVLVPTTIFSFLLKRSADNRLFLVKGKDIRTPAPITQDEMQDLGGFAGSSSLFLTVAYQIPTFSVGAVISNLSPFEVRLFEGSYPDNVAISSISNTDFAANFSNNNVTSTGFWLHEGVWGQASFEFAALDLNDFQIQSFAASGIVSVSTADNAEGSTSANPVRSYILPTVRLEPGQTTIFPSGRALLCKNDLSAAMYSLDESDDRYYDGAHRSLVRGENVPTIAELASSPSTNWDGDRIYQFSGGNVTVFSVDTTVPSIEREAVIPVQLPMAPSGYSIQIAKCEFIDQ